MVKVKKYREGTYYVAEYYVNDILVETECEEERYCGTSFFLDLCEEEDAEIVELGVNEYCPNSVLEALE